jgi:hypothetical protein
MSEFPTPNRQHDSCLMNLVRQVIQVSPSHRVSPSDLRAFNRCRLYLQVTHLSEITTADGKSITHDAWTGDRTQISPLLWPVQAKPGPKSFRTWRRLLAMAFLRGYRKRVAPNTLDLHLTRPLSSWLPGSTWLQNRWRTHYDATTKQLLRQIPPT